MTLHDMRRSVPPAVNSPGWSSSEPVHYCLRDAVRTNAFITAIERIVRPGDLVVEAGPGSGILALAAARAGAAHVIAVELDPWLADSLRRTVTSNGYDDRIEVIEGDASRVPLPAAVDLVIAELIDTGLLDERQAPVLNGLHAAGVIGPATRLVPAAYTTCLELVEVDDIYYDFQIAAPIHEWPMFSAPDGGWLSRRIRPLTARREVMTVDFSRATPLHLDRCLELPASASGLANAVRLSGVVHLAPGLDLGATNALNGDKILLLPAPLAVRAGDRITGRVVYEMGGGLASFSWRQVV